MISSSPLGRQTRSPDHRFRAQQIKRKSASSRIGKGTLTTQVDSGLLRFEPEMWNPAELSWIEANLGAHWAALDREKSAGAQTRGKRRLT